jgi:hypothetical protein
LDVLGIVRVAGEIAPNDPDLVEKTTAGTSVAIATAGKGEN